MLVSRLPTLVISAAGLTLAPLAIIALALALFSGCEGRVLAGQIGPLLFAILLCPHPLYMDTHTVV